MSTLKLKGKHLRSVGYPEGPVISIAMNVMERNFKHSSLDEALNILKNILQNPTDYLEHPVFAKIADQFIIKPELAGNEIALNEKGIQYNIFGAEQIEEGALKQMQIAARLPVSVAGALMPDAHHGYGLPIGGVLATNNVIIPYAVGVDIVCRMCLSIYPLATISLEKKASVFKRELIANTLFGSGREFQQMTDHEVLARPEFNEIAFLTGLQNKAAKQIGSSGSGNHFVEFGEVEIVEPDNPLGLLPGKYVGLLSHSGSRGMGASIASYYTQIAMKKTVLPPDAKHLAWLDLDSQEGIEYWMAMTLAGDYASACHHIIHDKIEEALGEQHIARVENHHNFAWKETYEGTDVIVHRKGATPAGKDVLGVIPGSMTAPGYIVKGKGESLSLNSASHGAGRKMSRTRAKANISQEAMQKILKEHGVNLIGGGLDEAPHAYKDIEMVMKAQQVLVDVVGKFYPKIVRMDG